MKSKIRVVLATGVFYPEVGGPAVHVRHIAERLASAGWEVVVITYSDSDQPDTFSFVVKRIPKKYPKAIRWILYSWNVFAASFSADIIYAFDVSAAGMPAFVSAKILKKKIVVRIGGDPIWERVVEKKKRFISLDEYYKKNLHLVDRPMFFRCIKFMLQRTDKIVTYTDMLIELYANYYHVQRDKILKIKNPFLPRSEPVATSIPAEPIFLFAGRFVAYKNLPLVIKVFAKLRERYKKGILKLIGSGPDQSELEALIKDLNMSQHIKISPSVAQVELFKEITNASVAIAPALTEFNPNFILESLSFNKPVILTRGNGLSISLPDSFLFDATNESELERVMDKFYDQGFYKKALSMVASFDLHYTWDDVVESHYNLLTRLASGDS